MCRDALKYLVIEQVEGQPEDNKGSRLSLRVTALKDFKARELIVPPYSLIDPATLVVLKTEINSKEADDNIKYTDRVFMRVIAKEKKKPKSFGDEDEPKAKEDPIKETFYVTTPLPKVSAKGGFEKISPLWAMTKTRRPAEVNMKLEPFVFDMSPMVPIGEKMPTIVKKPLWSVVMQCAANQIKIRNGDVLMLSVMQDTHLTGDSGDDED